MHLQPQSCSRSFVRDFVLDFTESTAGTVRAFRFNETFIRPGWKMSRRSRLWWKSPRAAYGFVSSSSRRWIVRSYSLHAAAEQRNLSLHSESKSRVLLAQLYENSWYFENISIPWVKIWTMKPMHGQGWTSPGHLFVWFWMQLNTASKDPLTFWHMTCLSLPALFPW